MQPDNQPNYFQSKDEKPVAGDTPDSSEEPEKLDNYTPTPSSDDSTPAENVESGDDNSDETDQEPDSSESVHWSAPESFSNDKGSLWYIIFIVIVLALIGVSIFLMKSYTFAALLVAIAVTVFVMFRHPSEDVNYTLSGNKGLYIGEKLYSFGDFKSFGLINDNGHNFIMLIPIKRFSPSVSVYFPDDVGEEVIDILGKRLPMENIRLDTIDIIVRKLHL